MCGLAGFVDFRKNTDLSTLKKMTDVLHHRGPDDSGYSFRELQGASIGLGHRRLSILDLSTLGHQPMEHEQLTVVYNGEVYNFKEIRKELEGQGYQFRSNSDTEVILKAYECWGYECVHRFIGMFAIALHDARDNSLWLCRDRAGVKPLYYYWYDGLLLFASELKSFHQHSAFKRSLSHASLSLFLQYGYIPEPHSIFDSASKLRAGHWMRVDLENAQQVEQKYWDVTSCYDKPKHNVSEEQAVEETECLLKSCCNYRMVSDVPVGVFLSGGYDSTAVAALLQSERSEKLKTFTIGFNEAQYNEAHHAARVAEHLGTDHTELYCSPADAVQILPKLTQIWDEPFGDASAIPTVLVSELARKDVTVSLSADGGDEIFAGYSWHQSILNKIRVFANIPSWANDAASASMRNRVIQKAAELCGMHNAEDRLNRFSLMLGKDERSLLPLSNSSFLPPELNQLLHHDHATPATNFNAEVGNDQLSNVLALDYKTYMLDDILTKVDRATMSVSLEGREPLLDHRLIEYVASLPNEYKIRDGEQKYLLKQIVHKYVPKSIMERPKMGFGVPIFEWFKDDLRDLLIDYLNEQRLKQAGILDARMVVRMRDQYLNGEQTNISRIWFLLVFELWLEQWA